MSRITNADIIRAQEARIESLTLLCERTLTMMGDVLAALTENRNRQASETVKIARTGTGDHSTAIAFEAVVQEGETVEQAAARIGQAFEKAAARYPLASGYAHPAQLGAELEAPPSLAEQLEQSAADELAGKRAKRGGKDGAK